MSDLYCDGGVIGRNPSELGGTWAFCIVENNVRKVESSGYITPDMAVTEVITNNLTEMLALLKGLAELPKDWSGTVYSDSQVTLGRAFEGWKWKNIPMWMHATYQEQRARLVNWDRIEYTLLQGHPTRAELSRGIGSRGYPVSIHNQWCDKRCGEMAVKFMGVRGEIRR